MNKYTDNGSHIIADDGRIFAVDTWHPMPVPDGISLNAEDECENGYSCNNSGKPAVCNHWLFRRPLPPVPKPKTQGELDKEAFITTFYNVFGPISPTSYHRMLWGAALAHARSTQPATH